MKIKLLLLLFILMVTVSLAQNAVTDSVIQKLKNTKNADNKVDIIVENLLNYSDSDPVLALKNQQQILTYSLKNKDAVSRAVATAGISYCYRHFGNTDKSLQYAIEGTTLAENTGNQKAVIVATNILALFYKDYGNYLKAIQLCKKVVETSTAVHWNEALDWGLENLADIYTRTQQYDSALSFAQRDYEVASQLKKNNILAYTYIDLAKIHGKLGNETLAKTYFDMALQESHKAQSSKEISWTYTAKAEFFKDRNNMDSTIVAATQALKALRNTAFQNYSMEPAKLLLDIYRSKNSDSAFKYSEIYHNAKDSLFSVQTIQQTQAMSFENDLSQQKIKQERKQNIQYALIAFGIIAFIILFLIFSRSIVANERFISFFGVLGLLIVFEFINLFIHPWLASFTHESPVLMLLALVVIASLLIPLHHRLEKWIKEKMIEKNKAIRLAAAKKTIQLLSDEKVKDDTYQTN